VALSAWCIWPEKPVALEKIPVAAPKVEPEKLTTKYIQRDEKTGEQFRCEKRDSAGVLRELEIAYVEGTKGTRHYDATGHLKRLVRTTESGTTLSADVDADGNFGSFEERNKKGVVVGRYKREKLNGYSLPLFKFYRDDGTLEVEVVFEQKQLVCRSYYDDGKTIHLEADNDTRRKWCKIYRPDGTLQFDEKITDPKAPLGSVVDHVATVYSPDGKPVERLTSNEGPYSSWRISVKNVEVLNADGSVKSSGGPERDGVGYRAKLINKVHQGFVDAIESAHKRMNQARWRTGEKEQDLKDVLDN
jgi:hypothetical protein